MQLWHDDSFKLIKNDKDKCCLENMMTSRTATYATANKVTQTKKAKKRRRSEQHNAYVRKLSSYRCNSQSDVPCNSSASIGDGETEPSDTDPEFQATTCRCPTKKVWWIREINQYA